MSEKIIECEADKNNKYYKVIQNSKRYNDGSYFSMNEIIVSHHKVDIEASDITKMGGFCISTYEFIFRWLVRGDTLCEVVIPEDSRIYKTKSDNGVYLSNKIILTNPKKIDDDFAMELYLNSNLPEKSYFITIAVCAICGYINTAIKICEDKVNKENIDIALKEFESFCNRREEEKYIDNCFAIETVNVIYDKLKNIKNTR